jgi:ribonuclease E
VNKAADSGAERGAEGGAENGQSREKRSRDRYGRERGPRNERGDQRGAERQESPHDTQQALDGFGDGAHGASGSSFEKAASSRQEERPPVRSYFSETTITAPPPLAPPAAPLAAAVAVAASAPVVAAPVPAVPVQAPVVAPAVVSHGLPKVQAFALPMEALNQVAQGSGLSWVNSDAAKVAQVQAAIAAEAKPIHVPRARTAPAQIDTDPLVLVETKRDLRSLQLPFEETRPE